MLLGIPETTASGAGRATGVAVIRGMNKQRPLARQV